MFSEEAESDCFFVWDEEVVSYAVVNITVVLLEKQVSLPIIIKKYLELGMLKNY